MHSPGSFLRNHSPKIYFFLVYLFNGLRKIFTPYSIYITDTLGGSFKEYIANPENKNRLSELMRGLDAESEKTLHIILERIKAYPDEKDKRRVWRRKPVAGGLLPVESRQMKKKIKQSLSSAPKRYKHAFKHLEESVFYYYHGLSLLPQSVLSYFKDKDFIDVGAYNGDSAIALKEFGFRKIFSIEMSHKSIGKYKNNMTRLGINDERYELINACITDTDGKEPIIIADTGSAGLSLLRDRGKYDKIFVEQKTIDTIVNEYHITPRFIKADIEGNGLGFARGAVNTLKNHRPVVSIAIYHNPYELFEVKPFLDSFLNDYTFLIRKLSTGVKNNLCHSDVFLIGFPNEISNLNKAF
jgi:FkbM family methyltransferase